MKDSTQSHLLHDESQPTLNQIDKPRSRSLRYSILYLIILGSIGVACLIAAIGLTIAGTVGLREYGFANGPLIAGIVLFGLGGSFSIAACVSAGMK